jgi:6-pyruvoyltetrahydropterin/6-carboxytetrahydropterin synthase
VSNPTVTTIEISKEYLHFNSAHFTIFSESAREDLHGHTFYVTATVDSAVGADGLAFDYNVMKTRLAALCDHLDEKVLLPEHSPYLHITEADGYVVACFADERIPFLPRDVLRLPVRNVTVEELAPWFLSRLCEDPVIAALDISRILIRVSSGPGQWAGATWSSAALSPEVST